MATQTWNNVLGYIKLELGAKYNLLELSDDEIVEGLRDHVLSRFSNYAPAKKYLYLSQANKLRSGTGQPMNRYVIPAPPGTNIIDITDVYFTTDLTIVGEYSSLLADPFDLMDMAMANSLIDAQRSMQVRNTWEFFPPNMMVFDVDITGAIVEYSTPHDTLETVRPDLYETLKDMCLAKTKMWIAALRSKYEGIATPLGTLNVGWEKLDQDGNTLWEKCFQTLETLPPDHLIHVSV